MVTKIFSPRMGLSFDSSDLTMGPLVPMASNVPISGLQWPMMAPTLGPGLQPGFVFNTQPVVSTPAPEAPRAVPTWAVIAGGAAVGVLATLLLARG